MSNIDWERVPIFPLQTVFFPKTYLPLHIFEPRYRQMTADCVAGGLPMAIVLAKPGEDLMGQAEVFPIAGVGTIERHERLSDGRYNLVLKGVSRIKILEEIPNRPYRVARAQPLDDRWPTGGEAALAKHVETLRACVSRVTSMIAEESIAADVRKRVGASEGPAMLVDVVASLFIENALTRQALLEELDIGRRLESVTGTLAELVLRATAARGGGTLQ